MPSARRCFAVALLLFSASAAAAADWPQWFGPQRDGYWREAVRTALAGYCGVVVPG